MTETGNWGGGVLRARFRFSPFIQLRLHFGPKKTDKILIFIKDLSEKFRLFLSRSKALHTIQKGASANLQNRANGLVDFLEVRRVPRCESDKGVENV